MRYDRNKIIKDRKILRVKKAMAVIIAFFIVFAFVQVDRNCGEMTGNEIRLVPRIVRIDTGTVKLKLGDTGETRGQEPVSKKRRRPGTELRLLLHNL